MGKKCKCPPEGAPEWVVTYGDMMSLLLTFFIMLVSLSELKKDGGTLRAMLDSINEAFGPTEGSIGVPGTSTQTNSAFNKMNSRGMRSEGAQRKQAGNRRAMVAHTNQSSGLITARS